MFIKFEIANDGFMSLKKIYGKKFLKVLLGREKRSCFYNRNTTNYGRLFLLYFVQKQQSLRG